MEKIEKAKRRQTFRQARSIKDGRAISAVPFTKMEEGGKVPAKFKGFSKLPEEVQMKMNPQAAKKYKNGGAVMSKRGGSFKGSMASYQSSKFLTPKAKQLRRKVNVQKDKIDEIVELEFDLGGGKVPLPGKRFANGGAVQTWRHIQREWLTK